MNFRRKFIPTEAILFSSNPLLSVLTKDCVEKLTDTCHRGARYDLWHILCEAVSNAADAAAAIQKFVFEEKVVTLPDLVEILKNNWEGCETLRLRFINEAAKIWKWLSRQIRLHRKWWSIL